LAYYVSKCGIMANSPIFYNSPHHPISNLGLYQFSLLGNRFNGIPFPPLGSRSLLINHSPFFTPFKGLSTFL
jgi:hypothetical protein